MIARTTEDDEVDFYFHFRTVDPVGLAEEMESIYSLRYAVYCKERSFLKAEDYPDGLELDEFDKYSVHFAAYNRESGIVGTVRLVIPQNHEQRFPFEDFCTPFPNVTLPARQHAAEISRLIVSPSYRRRVDDSMFGFSSGLSSDGQSGPVDPEFTRIAHMERRTSSPRILMGMFRKMYRYSKRHGITHWYAAMEHTLARLLLRYKFAFRVISPQIDYYGPVALYMASIAELEASLQKYNPDMLAWFQKARKSDASIRA